MKKKHRTFLKEPATPESEFRRLIDATTPSVTSAAQSPLETLSARYKLPTTSERDARTVLNDLLHARIATALSRESRSAEAFDSGVLRDQLLVRHFAERAPIWPYLGILDALRAGAAQAGVHLPRPRKSDALAEAFTAAHEVHLLNFSEHDQAMIRLRNKRQSGVADGIQRLREAGFQVTVLDGRGHIEAAEEARIAERIEHLVQELGAANVARIVFDIRAKRYDVRQQRYHFPRQHDTFMRGPSIPSAFILNLCAKHITTIATPAMGPGDLDAWKSLIRLSAGLVAALDVESYNVVELISRSGAALPRFLTDLARYDGMFTLFQFRPDDVEVTLTSLFDWLDDDTARRLLGWTIKEAALVSNRVLRKFEGKLHESRAFFASDICRTLVSTPEPTVRRILRTFAHDAEDVNKNYQRPQDQHLVDFWFKPLIALGDDAYLLLNRSWCASACYESIRMAVAEHDAQATAKIGFAFERLVRAQLMSHGVVSCAGKYKVQRIAGECDLVVESDDSIILLELKLKALTRKSRSGDTVQVFLDLTNSLLDAQAQLAQHEVLLYEQGALELTNSDNRYSLQRRGRRVDRVAVTLLDYGALQNRDTLFHLMNTMVTATISTSDPARQGAIEKIKMTATKLAASQKRLHELRPINGMQFYNCWSLSLGQLLVMLDDVTSNQSFADVLHWCEGISLGTLDPYYELSVLRDSKRTANKGTLDPSPVDTKAYGT
jgi:hypothetical protein